MTPLQIFAQTVAQARQVFETGRDMTTWLVFYEAKQTAYAKLLAALPQVKDIENFWRYVQNMAPAAWLPIIDGEIKRTTRSKYLCRDCAAIGVTWPQQRCAQCQKERRLETYRKAKKRERVKQQMRKCRVCKFEPLINPRQRVCASCQADARRERNRRYQKALRGWRLRRVQPDFTSKELSTLMPTGVTCQSRQCVDREGVLISGAAA
jgi:hypothetical protein